jgi:CTP synthase
MQQPIISERHRHRYEVNPALIGQLQSAGLLFSGVDADSQQRMEIVELDPQVYYDDVFLKIEFSYMYPISTIQTNEHPFFLAVQFHPEFKSRPTRCSPPFLAFVKAASKH